MMIENVLDIPSDPLQYATQLAAEGATGFVVKHDNASPLFVPSDAIISLEYGCPHEVTYRNADALWMRASLYEVIFIQDGVVLAPEVKAGETCRHKRVFISDEWIEFTRAKHVDHCVEFQCLDCDESWVEVK